MRLLLDTHTFLWYVDDNPKLSAVAKAAISVPSAEVFISPASYWEIAIKVSTGKHILNRPYLDFIEDHVKRNGFVVLPIEPRHTAVLIGLPFHHKDPFDRLLVAQAIAENIPIVTCDADLAHYPISRIW